MHRSIKHKYIKQLHKPIKHKLYKLHKMHNLLMLLKLLDQIVELVDWIHKNLYPVPTA